MTSDKTHSTPASTAGTGTGPGPDTGAPQSQGQDPGQGESKVGKALGRINPAQVPSHAAKPPPVKAPESAGSRGWSATRPVLLGMLALVVLVGGFGGWSAFTQIAGAVVASGQIEVDRNRQVVQHPDGGVVDEILVDEGDRVEAGDVLIRLDPKLLRARLSTAESQLYEIMARRSRLEAERDGDDQIAFPEDLLAEAKTNEKVADVLEGQRNLFEARNDSADKAKEQLGGRRGQITRQIEGIESQQDALEAQLTLIESELTDQQSLLDRGLAQASRVMSLQREEASLRGSVGELIAKAAEAGERISELETEILGLDTTRREQAITELRDLQFRELEYVETVDSLREQLSRMAITAPVSGIVYDLQVFAERSVIRPADPVLYIVPQDRPLVIAARVAPIHVDQVHVGQEVALKFSTFDQRTTPELYGEVLKISADAFTDEANRTSYYRAEIRLKEGEIDKLPGDVALIPGMPVEAYMRTADRTPIAFLVKPLADYFSKAFRES